MTEQIHRHHKRTPYASNTFPHEQYSWDCSDAPLSYYGKTLPSGTPAQIYWNVYTSPSNPLVPAGFPNSTCQFPQISSGGLQDALQHGIDLYSVYHDELGFLVDNATSGISYRVTNNVITSQVAGMVVEGMYPQAAKRDYGVLIQSNDVDSLEPAYSCSYSSSLYSSYSVGSTNPTWTAHLDGVQGLYSTLDTISGVSPTDAGWQYVYLSTYIVYR